MTRSPSERGPLVPTTPRRQQDGTERFIWTGSGIFIIALHGAAVIGALMFLGARPPSASMMVATALVLFLSHIGITAGYHRLYAHRAYKASAPVEALLLFLGTLAVQGPVIRWSLDHRAHHRYVDRDGDPYSVHRGFWHAHVLWIFGKQRPIDGTVRDLLENPLVRFQFKHFALLAVAGNLAVFMLVGWLLGDLLGAFVFVLLVRLVLSYHITWCINSLAHYWGSRSYSKELTARDNYLVALITVGEGYHNYHHTFPSDYRNGIRWFHVDPGKWAIWLLAKLGLASDLRSQPGARIRRTLIRKDTNLLVKVLRDAATGSDGRKNELEARFGPLPRLEESIARRAESLRSTMEELEALKAKQRELAGSPSAPEHRALRERLRARNRAFRLEWTEWCRLCGDVLQT